MSDALFNSLRGLVLSWLGNDAKSITEQKDLIPIEQTLDGWFCLLRDGRVAHVNSVGTDRECVAAQALRVALAGSLARRFPLATWFLPRGDTAALCPACGGTGAVTGIPDDVQTRIMCSCGGLGWVPVCSPDELAESDTIDRHNWTKRTQLTSTGARKGITGTAHEHLLSDVIYSVR